MPGIFKRPARSNLRNGVRLLTTKELQAYFQRIGADEKSVQQFLAGPSLAAICEIHRLQTLNVHVTNYAMQDSRNKDKNYLISPHFNDIFTKIVIQGQHGYCFENNQLLRHVLVNLGYQVHFYPTHIIRENVPSEDPGHPILVVEINQKKYLVDAGYGGVAPIGVIELQLDVEQLDAGTVWRTTTPTGNVYKFTPDTHKFDHVKEEKGVVLAHQEANGQWKRLYMFREKPLTFKEFVTANYHVSKDDKTTPFRTRIFETFFATTDTKISITRSKLTITEQGKTVVSEPVNNEKEYKHYLVRYFKYSREQLAQMGQVHDRVEFGKEDAPSKPSKAI